MTAPNSTTESRAGSLKWKSQWGYQTAYDSTCYYIRESGGSIIAAFVFSVAIAGSSGFLGVKTLVTPGTWGEKAFGVLMVIVASVFGYILVHWMRRPRWMNVYDRGRPGVPAEIRYQEKRLPADRVRSLSTRAVGGKTPQRTVVAELKDGKTVALGPTMNSTWPDHYAQEAATWMGLPYRLTRE